jgi:hypothetical protein
LRPVVVAVVVIVVCIVVTTELRGTKAHTSAHFTGWRIQLIGSGADGHSAMHCAPGLVPTPTLGFVVFIGSVPVIQGVSTPVLGIVTTGVEVCVSNVC